MATNTAIQSTTAQDSNVVSTTAFLTTDHSGLVGMGEPNSTADSLERLQALNDALADELTPVVVYLCLLAIIGFTGNLVTLYIFGFRLRMSTQHLLIAALAVFDLLQCTVCMPGEMYSRLNYVTLKSSGLCRLFRFAGGISLTGSGLTLTVIALDR
jgi:hypothetical protein